MRDDGAVAKDVAQSEHDGSIVIGSHRTGAIDLRDGETVVSDDSGIPASGCEGGWDSELAGEGEICSGVEAVHGGAAPTGVNVIQGDIGTLRPVEAHTEGAGLRVALVVDNDAHGAEGSTDASASWRGGKEGAAYEPQFSLAPC